jgi:hypothetical protein
MRKSTLSTKTVYVEDFFGGIEKAEHVYDIEDSVVVRYPSKTLMLVPKNALRTKEDFIKSKERESREDLLYYISNLTEQECFELAIKLGLYEGKDVE